MDQKTLKLVIDLYQSGLMTTEIGVKLNLSQGSVWYWLNKFEIEFRKAQPRSGHIPWNKDKKGVMPVAWNKGKTMPLEQRQRQSETRKKLFAEGKITSWLKGKKMSLELREKLSKIRKEGIKKGTIKIGKPP